MNAETWHLIDQTFNEDDLLAGRVITRALTVPTDSEILAAAKELGCVFHEDYFEFLKRHGGGAVGCLPVFGLRPAEILGKQWSVIEETQRIRSENWQGVGEWYIVSNDGFGNPIGIARNGQVMVSDHDAGQVSVLASDFQEFLLKWCLAKS